jgi:putative ABC transport system substrate-binding protein
MRTVNLVIAIVCGALFSLKHAQAADNIPRIACLAVGVCGTASMDGFRRGLRELGYTEGQNVIIEERSSADDSERLDQFARKLAQDKIDVILAVGGTQAAVAARRATKMIPIVFVIAADPVAAGLVNSLSRPGGNATGFSSLNLELDRKRVELLKEAIPRVEHAALLVSRADPAFDAITRAANDAAKVLGITLDVFEPPESEALDGAFATAAGRGATAVIVAGSPIFYSEQSRIAELATRLRLPVISPWKELPLAGGFMSYGVNIPEMFRRSAMFVDRILKGARPGDLPVEQPTKFELVINLKTAKALGLTIPATLLARADEVIE